MLLSTPTPPHRGVRRSISTTPPSDWFSDSRTHGYDGPTRNVRMPRVVHGGGGAISTNPDGNKCAVAGPGSLRILRFSDPNQPYGGSEQKSAMGRGGHRIDASRNMWEGSGLKLDSTSTDVAWGSGTFDSKILTSARNGELIMWDLNKSGSTKYERRTKDHLRSIHKLAISQAVINYCITGSADGDLRVWDLRDLSKSIMRIHHPTSVRSVAFSPNSSQPLQAITGLDNGSIYRWDLKMGQRGQLDRLPVAHAGSVTSLNWICPAPTTPSSAATDITALTASEGNGWLASGSLDRTVKVWDLNTSTHIPHKPTYTLHPSFSVRSVVWRPGYDCEIAIVSSAEFGAGSSTDLAQTQSLDTSPDRGARSDTAVGQKGTQDGKRRTFGVTGDAVEIWDVRKSWLAKWSISNSAIDGGITDVAFRDHHALLAQHASGSFSQFDLRDCVKPIDAISSCAAAWDVSGSLTFASNRFKRWEIPYDDVPLDHRSSLEDKWLLKSLGDRPFIAKTQAMATFTDEAAADDVDVISKLAKAYTLDGNDRQAICTTNAEAASEAGRFSAAQAWLLVGSLLTDLIPEESPEEPPLQVSDKPPALPPSVSAPSRLTSYTFPSNQSLQPIAISESAPNLISQQRRRTSMSPLHYTNTAGRNALPPPSTGKLTRSSSNSTNSISPRKKLSPLPPLVALPPVLSDRRSSLESSKSINTSMPSSSRRPSLFRRPSASAHSMSPSDKSFGSMRTKNVGEGALDDSDEDSSDDNGGLSLDDIRNGEDEADEKLEPTGLNLHSLASPNLLPSRGPPQPSPLSKPWSEDEEEAAASAKRGNAEESDENESASPRSTDTESGGSESSGRPLALQRRRSRRESSTVQLKKPGKRSRSSTVASLAAGVPVTPFVPSQALKRHDSRSSIQTVIAADTALHSEDLVADGGSTANHDRGRGVFAEETITLESMNGFSYGNNSNTRGHHGRQKSLAISELQLNSEYGGGSVLHRKKSQQKVVNEGVKSKTERSMGVVRKDEERMRKLGWEALRQAVVFFSEEGDVQTCAMLATIAPRELKISAARAMRFIDAYIELLDRLRLPMPTAYLRKRSKVEAVRSESMRQTDIYTSCGKCHKALAPTVALGAPLPKGGYTYCASCRTSAVKCAICRLPVKALLMQCAICCHGGHLECYQQYYAEQPTIGMTSNSGVSSTRPASPAPFDRTTGRRAASYQMTPAEAESKIVGGFPLSSSPSGGVGLPAANPMSHQQVPLTKKLMGYPCAAGCGHFCWAASQEIAAVPLSFAAVAAS